MAVVNMPTKRPGVTTRSSSVVSRGKQGLARVTPLCSPIGGRPFTRASRATAVADVPDRPKVLCLGMSYPNMDKQLAKYNVDLVQWLKEACSQRIEPRDVVRAVRQGYLTEMDGRDLARCIASEQICNVDVYTVSQEKAACYETNRHLEANFNRHQFLPQLHVAFAQDQQGNRQEQGVRGRSFDPRYIIRFRQVVLDYFWIPQGWDGNHWQPSFFADILVGIVRRGMLDMNDSQDMPCAVYLPFCFHCFRQVINALDKLQTYYAISFVYKHELGEVTLWKGTQSIDPVQMQTRLGKQRDQEEVYCTFGYREVNEAGTGVRDETKDVLIDYLSQLEDFYDIRFIKLRPLRQHHPTKKTPSNQHEVGGLRGLKHPKQVKRGFRMSVDQVNESRKTSCSVEVSGNTAETLSPSISCNTKSSSARQAASFSRGTPNMKQRFLGKSPTPPRLKMNAFARKCALGPKALQTVMPTADMSTPHIDRMDRDDGKESPAKSTVAQTTRVTRSGASFARTSIINLNSHIAAKRASRKTLYNTSTKTLWQPNDEANVIDAGHGLVSITGKEPQIREAQVTQVAGESSTTLRRKRKSTPPIRNDEEQRAKRVLIFIGEDAAKTALARTPSAADLVSSSSRLPTRSSRYQGTFLSLPDKPERKRQRKVSPSLSATIPTSPKTELQPCTPSAKAVRTVTPSPTSVMTDNEVKLLSNAGNTPTATRRFLDLN